MKYCELQETPEFQYTVDNLRDTFGVEAEHVAYKSFLENGGQWLTPDEIIRNARHEYFSIIPGIEEEKLQQSYNREIDMTQQAMFKEIGISVPKKQISQQQITNLRTAVSKINNELYKKGVPRNYQVLDVVQTGQSDNFTWRIAAFPGKVDIDLKAARIQENLLEKSTLPGTTAQHVLDLRDQSIKFLREMNPQEALIVEMNEINSSYLSPRSNERTVAQEIAQKIAKGLSEQLSIDYQMVTAAEAWGITKDSKNPWNGERAFFVGGRVYFVGESINPEMVVHEFAHPFVRAIAIQNQKLFDQLYNNLVQTPDGKQILDDTTLLYKEFVIDSNEFREEVLVRGLEKAYNLKEDGLAQKSGFKKAISDIFYQIKQLLRKVFGIKSEVSTLNSQTTLKQLAEMLKQGGKFDVNVEEITEEDIVSYKREHDKQVQDLIEQGLDKKEIEDLTNKYFDLVSKQLTRLTKEEKYPELLEIVKNKYKAGELQKMKQNLKPYQTLIMADALKMQDEVELTKQRAVAVINSLNNLGNMMGKVYEGLQEITKDINDPKNVQRVLYYQNTLNYWNDFVNTASDSLELEGVKLPMVDKITTLIKRSNTLVNKFYEETTGDILWDTLSVAADNINNKWDERIKDLEKRNASKEIIDEEKKKAALEKISKETIKKALKGEIKDLSFAGFWLEGYGYSPNPIVGGTSLFIKNAIAEVEAVAQRNVNQQADELSPLLKENNYNPNQAGQLGIDLGQKEKVGRVNLETGEFEEVEVWRFMNEFNGADLARDKYFFKIKEASLKYQETGTDEDAKKLADIQAEWEQHRRDYFNQEYTEAFYKAFDYLKKDDIGKEAKARMDEFYAEINQLQNSGVTAQDEIDISNEIESVRRQLKQLSSLTDVFGNKKTGRDLEIAERIKQFNEATKDIYYTEEIPGAFEEALDNYEQKLIDEGKGEGSEAYNTLRSQWIEKNTRTVIDDTFWETLNDVNNRIKDILETLPNDVAKKLEIEDAYKEIKDILTGNKDESGQPVGAEINEESLRKVKAAQEKILKAQEFLNKTTGLTKAEKVVLESIFAKIDSGHAKEADYLNLNRLLDKQDIIGLDKLKRAALRGLYSKLEDLRQREATDSYVETVNAFLSNMENNPLYEKIGSSDLDKTNVYVILNEEILPDLFAQSPEFEKWFMANHFRKPAIDQTTGQEIEKWEKTYAWNVIRPKDPQYLKKTELKDNAGNVIETITGLPTMKYFKRLVKDEFFTKKVVGETVDNLGRWLPKTAAQGAKDTRYVNEDYFKLRIQDPKKFRLLEKMKEIHLRNQEGAHGKSKLWYDFPRYRKHNLERLRDKPVERIIQSVKNFWGSVKDKWDSGFNYSDDLQLTKMDLFDNETTGVPISGLSNIEFDETSTDITLSMMRYMLSLERQKKLLEIAPTIKAIQQVVNNKKNFPFVEQSMGSHNVLNMNKKKDKFMQAEAINNIVEKTFEGKSNVGWGSDNAAAQNFSNLLFKQASFSYLALNIPSAIKNSISMKFQGLVESAAGKHFSTKEFLAAEKIATNVTFQISGEIYKKGSKSLNVQIVELFDPERDRFSYSIGESLSRTPLKDTLLPLQRMNDFRKWVQLQSSLQGFFAMMKHQSVKQGDKDIPYLDAWEVVDGRLQLKKDIDPAWGITYDKDGKQLIGNKYKAKRAEIHRVMDNMNGAMGKEDRSEAERYLLFRYLIFFRRWMTSMFVNRFAYSGDLRKGTARGRADYSLGDTKQGFYITNLQFLYKAAKSMGKYIPYASKEEKQAMIRLTTEIGTLLLMSALIPAMFDYDPDDPDRFKKLRAKSGALPLPFVPEDPNRPFELGGWISNHLLLLMTQIRAENDQFLPAPGLGLDDYKQTLDVKSLVFGPTLKNYATMAQDLGYLATGDDKAYYKRDIGSYDWQKADEAKIFSHIAKSFGLSGGTIDAAVAMKNFESIQNR